MKATAQQKKVLKGVLLDRTIRDLNNGIVHEGIVDTEGWNYFIDNCSNITMGYITDVIDCEGVTSDDVYLVISELCIEIFLDPSITNKNRECQSRLYDYMDDWYTVRSIERNPLTPHFWNDDDEKYGHNYRYTYEKKGRNR